jgi:ATP-dependent helicase/nuclease subunit B
VTDLKGLYSIPAGHAFAEQLAEGLFRNLGPDPQTLAAATVLLPTRRACITLRDAFLRVSAGRALLLPRLLPLGDIDEEDLGLYATDAPWPAFGETGPRTVMAPLRRQLLLARLILHWAEQRAALEQAPGMSADQALRLASALARLQDQIDTEGLELTQLTDLVPENYAAHWQDTLKFLAIVSEAWPRLEADLGAISPAKNRRQLTLAQAEAWRSQPPEGPVIVAGSTGSVPATAALIASVAALPQGAVVLPGLDLVTPDDVWGEILRDPSHPQFGMAQLLERLEAPRDQVKPWPAGDETEEIQLRRHFATVALYPAESTLAWRAFAEEVPQEALKQALAGVSRIDCSDPGEEARVIALMMRGQAGDPARTAALVTPDRNLARRVAAELRRWSIEVDDSAGTPLGKTPPGAFLQLLAEAAAARWAPLDLLSLLKHPLAAAGEAPGAFRRKLRRLEDTVLRGPRPAAGLEGLRQAISLSAGAEELSAWFDHLAALLSPLEGALLADCSRLSDVVAAHLSVAEALAESDSESGASRLWSGEAGEMAASFASDILGTEDVELLVRPESYPALFAGLLGARDVRPRYGRHPRLQIWGPLEARMQSADLLILGGLNEGTWPALADPGPWLSRPMLERLGLPSPERGIGLAAHDFLEAFSAPRVVLTRAKRVEGTPGVPSRWLLRLDALAKAVDVEEVFRAEDGSWQYWAGILDALAEPEPCSPPAPRPPVSARPRKLSVTRIETWMRDPYGLYAERILDLRARDPIDADPGAADLGILIHKVLELYFRRHPEGPPDDPLASLLAFGAAAFSEFQAKPGVWAFWWPRFQRIAAWFANEEAQRSDAVRRSFAEVKGELTFAAPAGAFTLTATADRIDLTRQGELVIIDYKTGGVPAKKDIELGFAPQLPLEGAIARAGGFADVSPATLSALAFWRLTGGEPPGRIHPVAGNASLFADQALAGLEALVCAFDDPQTPYRAVPRPGWAPRYSDYAHLARLKEWAFGGEGEEP